MIEKSDAASIFRGTRGSRSIEISVPGAFTAVGFSGQQKNPGASAAERGRPSLFKTIDEDRRERHDHINRSGKSTYPGRISVLRSGATPIRRDNGVGRFSGTTFSLHDQRLPVSLNSMNPTVSNQIHPGSSAALDQALHVQAWVHGHPTG